MSKSVPTLTFRLQPPFRKYFKDEKILCLDFEDIAKKNGRSEIRPCVLDALRCLARSVKSEKRKEHLCPLLFARMRHTKKGEPRPLRNVFCRTKDGLRHFQGNEEISPGDEVWLMVVIAY